MPASDYGRSLRGLTLNLLVRSVAAALPFHREVLDAEVVYSDPDFAVLRRDGPPEWRGVPRAAGPRRPGELDMWMLHADHAYDNNPFKAQVFEDLAKVYRALGKVKEADEAWTRAAILRTRR